MLWIHLAGLVLAVVLAIVVWGPDLWRHLTSQFGLRAPAGRPPNRWDIG